MSERKTPKELEELKQEIEEDEQHLKELLEEIVSLVDLVTVSKILGHSSIQMTMRYAHPTPENMQRAVDKLADIFDRNEQKGDYNALLNQYRPFISPPPSA